MAKPADTTPVVPGVTVAVPLAQADAAEVLRAAIAKYDAATASLASARQNERNALQAQAIALNEVNAARQALQAAAERA